MKITWIGHACFAVEENGFRILFDPYADDQVPGYQNIREEADLVLCSHGHSDHNAADLVTLRRNGAANPFTAEEIHTFHDPEGGKLRGENTIRILTDGNLRIAHLGDLGCELPDAEKEKLKNLDVMLIPVGGFFTIDGNEAAALAEELSPKVIIPMHFRNGKLGYDVIDTVETFASHYTTVLRPGSSVLNYPEDVKNGVVILTPQNG